jgi:hypothetical protein
MNLQIKNKAFLFFLTLLLTPIVALAQTFVPLVGIPGATTGGGDLSAYLNAIYRISISLAALLAVLVLIKAGVKYMFSDIVTDKASAKSDIRGAILGLLLIISAVLILSTINENITNFSISIDPIEVPPPGERPITPGGGAVSELNQWCEGGGGCAIEPCESLGSYVTTALGGAGAGVAIAITAGVLGLTTPVGWIALATIGAGAAVGGQYGAEQSLCYATCSWLGGRIENNSCYIPNDVSAANEAEFERAQREMDERFCGEGRRRVTNTIDGRIRQVCVGNQNIENFEGDEIALLTELERLRSEEGYLRVVSGNTGQLIEPTSEAIEFAVRNCEAMGGDYALIYTNTNTTSNFNTDVFCFNTGQVRE